MTSATSEIYGDFGRTLAFAERTLSAILREHLARRDTQPEQWYALKLLARAGAGGASRDEVVRALSSSPTFSKGSAEELLSRLEAEGLVEGQTHIGLTARGQAVFAELRAYVAGPTDALLSQFDLDDIETTVRTLQGITDRASTAG
jgi:DNA-binding MarR family transcriptional regulator